MPNEYEHFIKSMMHWGTNDWLNGYFDMLKLMLIHLGLNRTSQQLAMTGTQGMELNVNIGQRWVSRPYGNEKVGLILPIDIDETQWSCERHTPFKRRGLPEANWVTCISPSGSVLPELFHHWEDACTTELKRTKKSGYRKHHNELYFDVVMNEELRKEVFEKAFK
jgi:hypothetical protein